MPTYISLFSSAGVGCYGFKMENFDCIATNELIERRLNVQRYNEKCKYPSGYILGDVTDPDVQARLFREIDFWRQREHLKEVDVVVATPPCQGMSVANHKKTDHEIVRNSLVVESIRLIREIRPRFFVMENVPAFLKTLCTDLDGVEKPIGEAIDQNLGGDYSICAEVINFKNHGACSRRQRTLVTAVRRDLADFIAPSELFPDYAPEKTLRDTIGHLPALTRMGATAPGDIYHNFRPYPTHMRAWVETLREGQSAFDNTDPLRVPHTVVDGQIVVNQRKNGDKYRRQYWDKVGPCIHTRNDQFASQNTVHPADDRVFSIRELMLMMGVPATFRWSSIPVKTLNAYTDEQKAEFFRREEIKIRQSLGEAVPTVIFQGVAHKIRVRLAETHLKTAEVQRLVDANGLADPAKLSAFLNDNLHHYCGSTLRKIAELSNAQRTSRAAYYTNKMIVTELLRHAPRFDGPTVRILEPSVGAGNFLPLVIKKYAYVQTLIIDVVDIDADMLAVLKLLMSREPLPANTTINYIHADFLLYPFSQTYDLVVGNPPFNKSYDSPDLLARYQAAARNRETSNIFAFFLEKALKLGACVALISPKFLLNTPEFRPTRAILEHMRLGAILDFGEHGFEKVLVETVGLCIYPNERPGKVFVRSLTQNLSLSQRQSYICDAALPYWLIYRSAEFDRVFEKMELNVFTVFRDRQLTNRHLNSTCGIRVIKSRNISDDGDALLDIPGYDSYVTEEDAKTLAVYKYLDVDNIYLTPNMTYNPRVMKKPKGTLVNGSAAILIPKGDFVLTETQRRYFSSPEYRAFYRIARNHQTRSLNVDAASVFFFGRLKEE